MHKVSLTMACWENGSCMGGGELGVDYLISDYNVLILNDGIKKWLKKKQQRIFFAYIDSHLAYK